MCGIVGLHLRDDRLHGELGSLLSGMMCRLSDRGPDSAGVGLYGDPRFTPPGHAAVGVLEPPADLADRVGARLGEAAAGLVAVPAGLTTVLHAPVPVEDLLAAVRSAVPGAVVTGWGDQLAVIKGVGHPARLAANIALSSATGYQAVAHTRMATESAVTPAGSHPFAVGPDLCLVHNGSFSNHASVRRELRREGVEFDSDNDSEVGARFVAHQLEQGADLEKALRLLGERLDGFYTLLVTTADSFAVVRDPIACKPALIAVHDDWVAMASEYRAFTGLPGVAAARLLEPDPAEVYLWRR